MSPSPRHTTFSILRPPYDELAGVGRDANELRRAGSGNGSALIWSIHGPIENRDRNLVRGRPGGMALIVVLPRLSELSEDPEVIRFIGQTRPHGILPYHDEPAVADLAQVLKRPPADLGAAVSEYLRWRGLEVDSDTTHLLRRTIDLSAELRSITALSRSLYMSRRALGRRFLSRGLPVPSHWLQFGRLLRVLTRLQNRDDSVFSIAYELGYPDGFAVSNQMQRLVGVRPSDVRRQLGWEWFMEAWLRREAESGGLAPTKRPEPKQASPLGGEVRRTSRTREPNDERLAG